MKINILYIYCIWPSRGPPFENQLPAPFDCQRFIKILADFIILLWNFINGSTTGDDERKCSTDWARFKLIRLQLMMIILLLIINSYLHNYAFSF